MEIASLKRTERHQQLVNHATAEIKKYAEADVVTDKTLNAAIEAIGFIESNFYTFYPQAANELIINIHSIKSRFSRGESEGREVFLGPLALDVGRLTNYILGYGAVTTAEWVGNVANKVELRQLRNHFENVKLNEPLLPEHIEQNGKLTRLTSPADFIALKNAGALGGDRLKDPQFAKYFAAELLCPLIPSLNQEIANNRSKWGESADDLLAGTPEVVTANEDREFITCLHQKNISHEGYWNILFKEAINAAKNDNRKQEFLQFVLSLDAVKNGP